ncbi:MAG: hypothetical protein LBJ71_00605 [Holosporaceae bacterium]|jgi:hypothetical protein|nr:hypothetical protein [Holosporaceae bacterium]
MKKTIKTIFVFCGIAIFGGANAAVPQGLLNFFNGAKSTVQNVLNKHKDSAVLKAAEGIVGTAFSVGTNLVQAKAQSLVIQPLITNVKSGAATLQQKISEQIKGINQTELQILNQENNVVVQAQAEASQANTAAAQAQVKTKMETEITALKQQENQLAALGNTYNASLGQINSLLSVAESGDLNRMATEVPQISNQIVTTLASTPLQGVASQLLTQSANNLANEAAREINTQNTNLQNYGQQVTVTQ